MSQDAVIRFRLDDFASQLVARSLRQASSSEQVRLDDPPQRLRQCLHQHHHQPPQHVHHQTRHNGGCESRVGPWAATPTNAVWWIHRPPVRVSCWVAARHGGRISAIHSDLWFGTWQLRFFLTSCGKFAVWLPWQHRPTCAQLRYLV